MIYVPKPRRASNAPRRVPEVETLPCPAHDGTHDLTNDARARTRCRHCLRSWAEIDAEARG